MPKQKQPHPATPTPQDYDQDRFYYNNEEDFREVMREITFYEGRKTLNEVKYTLNSEEDERVNKFW